MLSPETSTLLTLCCYGAATVAGLAGMLLRNAFWRRLGFMEYRCITPRQAESATPAATATAKSASYQRILW